MKCNYCRKQLNAKLFLSSKKTCEPCVGVREKQRKIKYNSLTKEEQERIRLKYNERCRKTYKNLSEDQKARRRKNYMACTMKCNYCRKQLSSKLFKSSKKTCEPCVGAREKQRKIKYNSLTKEEQETRRLNMNERHRKAYKNLSEDKKEMRKEKDCEYSKKYHELNKDKINEKKRLNKCPCNICGSVVNKNQMKRHQRTKKCLSFVE
jgi:hypothetical protein